MDDPGGWPAPGDTGHLPPYDPYDPYASYPPQGPPAHAPQGQQPYPQQSQPGYGYDPSTYPQAPQQQAPVADPYAYDPYQAGAAPPGYPQHYPQQPQQPQQPQPGYPTGYPQQGGAGPHTGQQPRVPPQYQRPDAGPTGPTAPYDPGYQTGEYPAYRADAYAPGTYQPDPAAYQAPQQPGGPPPGPRAEDNPYDELAALATPEPEPAPGQPPTPAGGDYRTEQFAFVDDQEEDEEVIDWLKFAETRTERRDERRRQLRNRLVGLCVVLALVLAGGVGYLWWQDKLPFGGSEAPAAAAAGQKRDVIVVHLQELDNARTSTVLLVNNETAGSGTGVLLPNALAVATEDAGSTTLGQSVDEEGAGPTRDALSTLLGADIKGTWRLDSPFLELLVESVGGITLDTNAEVRGTGDDKGKQLVRKGREQELRGAAAVAYATYRAPGESADAQLARFGAVMQAVLTKVPSESDGATRLVESLGSVADPSLPENELGASLAPLAGYAKAGKYRTVALSTQDDGTLDAATTKGVVKDVLGGTVRNTDPQATPRITVRNATGDEDAAGDAQVALVNGGYAYVAGGTAKEPEETTRVEYVDPVRKAVAEEVARTLGLPRSAAKKVRGEAGDLDITVVLGQDYSE